MNKEQYKTYLRQRLNEEHNDNHDYIKPQGTEEYTPKLLNLGGGTIDNHPHGALTDVLARHLGLDASDVFETTGALTADSPQEHVDSVIGDLISQHGDRLFNKLSNEPGDLYHTPTARYGSTPERDFDARDAHDTEVERQYERFVGDLTDHINDNMSTGEHTEFKGTPRYDGVE